MDQTGITRRDLLIGTAVAVATIPFQGAYASPTPTHFPVAF
jgi:hypothetical protein